MSYSLLNYTCRCGIIVKEFSESKGGNALNRLLDKLAILSICMIGLCISDSYILHIAALLTAITASSAAQLLNEKRSACVIIMVWAILCGTIPVFFCTAPLVVYDALWEKKPWLAAPCLLILTYSGDAAPIQIATSFAGFAAALIIYNRVSSLERDVIKLTSLRDEVTEKNIQLSQQNTRLARAQDNEVHLATLRERNRIAREIHDNVGHMLTRSLLQSGALLIINKDENMKEPLTSLRNTLDSAMTSIRESVHDLHDDSIDLRRIIEDSLKAVSEKFTVKLDFDISNETSGKIKLCIAGVVKEAISNAAKHSNGDKITVILREHPVFYQVMVEDNGSCSKINDSGIGLKNMTERAEGCGGIINFTPSAKGFRVFMSLPKE